jgi:hypothetical protein
MQLNLGFPDPIDPRTAPRRTTLPPPTALPWDQIDPNAKKTVIQTLARAITQTLGRPLTPRTQEHAHDR